MTAGLRRAPPSVVALAVLYIGICCYAFASDDLLIRHPVDALFVALLLALWLAAIVVWHKRWAWALLVLASLGSLLEPLWGHWYGWLASAVDLVSLGLLLAPSMRGYVGVRRQRAHDASRR